MSDDVRDVTASLREGDEVEVTYETGATSRGVVGIRHGRPVIWTTDDHQWWFNLDKGDSGGVRAVRVIKRAPLPEPPAGTPVWFRGEWWLGMEQHNARPRYFRATDIGANDWRVWETMNGAVPAATPGGDE